MSHKANPLSYLHALDRYRFLMILNAANKCEEFQFAKKASMLWLANYPGDLFVKYHQAITYANLDKKDQAIKTLEDLLAYDPEFIEPMRALSDLENSDLHSPYDEIIQYLTNRSIAQTPSENWLQPLYEARQSYQQGDYPGAIDLIHQSLVEGAESPLPAILHIKTAYKIGNQEMLNNLAEIYFQQWPNCLQINIIKALAEMDQGQEAAAVERLHWIAAHDSAGQVIQRLMGSHHRFLKLWPDRLEIAFDLPLPASVSADLGWNQIDSGEVEEPEFKQASISEPQPTPLTDEATREIRIAQPVNIDEKTISDPSQTHEVPEITEKDEIEESLPQEDWATNEDFEEIQKVFSTLAKKLKKPDLERADNRFPVYVIISSKQQLQKVYGPNTANIIDEHLTNLATLIQKLPDWGSLVFFPDDPEQMASLDLKPRLGSDAWQVKLSLADLDNVLAKRGEMIGALLIVGGPEIIPFHHLPNPTHDNDLDVPSDNPYATIDKNYFIPQWPVGRLPGEKGQDAGLLLQQIRTMIYQYEKRSKQSKIAGIDFGSIIKWFLQLFSNLRQNIVTKQNLGYSAEIWRQASSDVYKIVGRPKDLQLSPPINARSLVLKNHHDMRLAYFNLHGVKDGPHWYGQKDFTSESNGPDYPIALSPDMFNEYVQPPKLILSEACYGANVISKHHAESLSLKCLDTGTTSFIGSTCIAYGSIAPPLIAADFLAAIFWQKVLTGQAAGYALMEAKLRLAQEMTRTQGFLDGEDQKTILSFVLYGDPLQVHDGISAMPSPLFRFKSHPAVRTLSDSDLETADELSKIPKGVDKEVKKVVEKYLPGLENAQMQYSKTKLADSGMAANNHQSEKTIDPERYVVTLKKSYEKDPQITHYHFARMTFDQKGKMVKLTTSR